MPNDEELPKDPINALAEGAAQLHELFITWMNAGFTEKQALHMLGVMLAESFRNS